MKTFSPVSSLRMASAAAALAILAVSPAWAGKYASIVIDMDTAKVLHARDADEPRFPASLTKVMTLYLAFDALDAGKLKLTDKMTVSRVAQHQAPSRLGLRAGQTITVEDAVRALVTKSANDVAVVLAEKLGGTEKKFAVKMNAKAKELGLENTHFENASGLPNREQVSTARDLAKLAEAMFYDHRDRYNYFSTPEFTWKRRHYDNHNNLLGRVEGVDGIKTGYTNASGYNLMASAERGGHRVIAVMLGGSTGRSRDEHVADLLEAAFLSINGGTAMVAAEPPPDQPEPTRAALKGAKPKNGADALAAAQLQRFAAIDASEEAAAADPRAHSKHADDSTEEGDEESPPEGGADEAATVGGAKITAVAIAAAAAASSPAAAAVAAIPAAAALVAKQAPAAAAPGVAAAAAPPAPVPAPAAVTAPAVDSPLLAPAATGPSR